jgi:hypothetical protein
MKQIMFYGPGNSFATLVEDDVARELKGKFDRGEPISFLDSGLGEISIRAGSTWAIKVEEFADRRRRTDTQQ